LRRSPAFALVVVATLAVAIGANTAVFTVVNATLFSGFPLAQRNDRIVYITTNKDAVYYPDFEEWRAQAMSFEGVALARNIYVTLGDDSGGLEAYFTTEVTTDAFSLLGVTPLLGRDFLPGDQQPGAEPVAILRYDLWKRDFGGDPAIIGQSVRINGIPTTVIAVMPATFSFPTDQELWIPLVPTPAAQNRETFYARYVFARLADAATIEDARAEMEVIGRRLASEYPNTNRDITPVLSRFDQWAFGPKASVLYEATWGAVAFVLLIACSNVASLLLDRALGRSREVSIRLALGAGRWRTMRQLLLESLILSGLGGAAGWWISKLAVRTYALEQASGGIERVLDYAMGYTALAYLVSISVATGLVVGPAGCHGRRAAQSQRRSEGRHQERAYRRTSYRALVESFGCRADGTRARAADERSRDDPQLPARRGGRRRRRYQERSFDVPLRRRRTVCRPNGTDSVLRKSEEQPQRTAGRAVGRIRRRGAGGLRAASSL
jgi:predicted permease